MNFSSILFVITLSCHFTCIIGSEEDSNPGDDRPVNSLIRDCFRRDDGGISEVYSTENLTDARLFYEEYVQKRNPIMLRAAANESLGDFDVQRMIDLPQAFTIYVDVRIDGRLSDPMSIRQVFRNVLDKDISVDVPIPTAIKAYLIFPVFLECDPIKQNLLRTRLKYSSIRSDEKPVRIKEDSLLCQVMGTSRLTITNDVNAEFKESLDHNCFKVSLTSGDCLYLPAGWSYKKFNSDSNLMIWMTWRKSNSDVVCGTEANTSLISLTFSEDPPLEIISFFEFGDLHHVIESYFMRKSEENINLDVFEVFFKQDTRIGRKINWTKECSADVTEMFNMLDINTDGILSPDDLDTIKQQDLKILSTMIEKMYAKFKGSEKKTSGLESIFDLTQMLVSDMEQNVQNMLMDEFAKLFEEIEEVEKEIEAREAQEQRQTHTYVTKSDERDNHKNEEITASRREEL